MSEILVLRLARDGHRQATGVIVDGTTLRCVGAVQTGELAMLAPLAEQRKVVVIVPGTDVLVATATVPVRGTSRMLQAVPYALEEQLAEDVSSLHFAIGKRNANHDVPVHVVSRTMFEAWLGELEAEGIRPAAIVTDTALLPPAGDDAVTVAIDAGECFIGGGNMAATTCQTSDLEQVLDLYGLGLAAGLDDSDAEEEPAVETSREHLTVYVRAADRARHEGLLDRLGARAREVELREAPDDYLLLFAPGACNPPDVNLLQGEYAPKTAVETLWRPWRVAAMLLIALVVVTLGVKTARLIELRAEASRLDSIIASRFQEVFPGQEVYAPREQVGRVLNDLAAMAEGGEEAFLVMLASLAEIVASTPNTRLEELSYRSGVMDLRLSAPDGDTLEKIRGRLADGGLSAQIELINPREGSVEGRLEVRRPSA